VWPKLQYRFSYSRLDNELSANNKKPPPIDTSWHTWLLGGSLHLRNPANTLSDVELDLRLVVGECGGTVKSSNLDDL